MRTHFMTLALAAVLVFPATLPAQNTSIGLSHNSPEAFARLLENRDALQLTAAQVERLNELQVESSREQTRLVLVGWTGAPGKARVPKFERVRVAPRPDRYAEVRTSSRIVAFTRVPGKAVPRLARIRVTLLVERPCPFTFLAADQLDKAHELLIRM